MLYNYYQPAFQKELHMNIFPPGSIPAGIFLLFSILSGIWLTRIGRPLNVVVMTIHKLIALGALIFTGVGIYNLSLAVGFNLAGWINILIIGLLFLTLFASGAILSGGKITGGALLVAHKVFPALTAICIILMFYHVAIGR
jgi:hypothetical protein